MTGKNHIIMFLIQARVGNNILRLILESLFQKIIYLWSKYWERHIKDKKLNINIAHILKNEYIYVY